MKKLIALAAALAMAVAIPSTALAQTDTGTANVTFELKLAGEVPGWQNFVVEHYVDGKAVQTPLCTTGANAGPAVPFCKTGGVYTAVVQVPVGAPVAFDFIRADTRTAPERFFDGSRTFAGNTLVAASYDFPGTVPVSPSTTGDTVTDTPTTTAVTTDGDTATAAAVDSATAVSATNADVASPAPATTIREATVAASGETALVTDPGNTSAVVGGTTSGASGATSGSEGVTAVHVLPDTGGSSLLAALGGSLLLLILAGFAVRKRI